MAKAQKAASGVSHKDMANAIRALSMDAVEKAKSGHPGMPMGMADVATVLFADVLSYDATDPDWMNRDRFVLSAGHGSMLLYSLLYLTGYPGMEIDDIKNFRQLGAKTAGHPEHGHAAGIETTTGPLGQGIANAVGMALAERLLNARTGGLVEHHTYCIAGDGCLMEGISQEAISLAGHLKLGKLVLLWDDNQISIDGATSMAVSDDQLARFAASGWNTAKVDGHDAEAVKKAIETAKADSSRPWMIACRTRIGFGAPNKEGKASAHGEPLGAEEIAATRARIGWPHGPFEIPADVLEAWRAAGKRGARVSAAWNAKLSKADAAVQALLQSPAAASRQAAVTAAVREFKAGYATDPAKRATRVWSQLVLEKLIPIVPEMIGGSADLTGSNLTRTKHHTPVGATDFKANYIHYGVREHGMAAAMNGMALHGGIIPYGATFLVFTDYCRPSIRLSALMQQRVVYVMTHDSIGLGEDGPTHQPVEHMAALRAIPNLNVFRPAEGVETAECWELALAATDTPSILALTRQAVPNLRSAMTGAENMCARGGYVLREPEGKRDVTLIATGSELGLAAEAAEALAKDGIAAAVVSMPSFELFRKQTDRYRYGVLGDAPRIAIEAGIAQGWHEWLRHKDRFIGMTGFGASAPAPKLYEHFGITTAKVVEAAKALVG